MQSLASDPPSDVLQEICAFLDTKRAREFVTAAAINRRWREFVCDGKRHWKLEIGVRTDGGTAERVALMLRSTLFLPHVARLLMVHYVAAWNETEAAAMERAAQAVVALDAVCAAMRHVPRLESFCTPVYGELTESQLRGLKACATLRRLDRPGGGWRDSELAVLTSYPPMAQLEYISFNTHYMTAWSAPAMEGMVGLRELEPICMHREALASVAKLPRLEKVRMCLQDGMDPNLPPAAPSVLSAIGHLGATLHTLRLEQMNLNSAQLSKIVAAVPLLTQLTLLQIPILEDLRWLQSCLALQWLSVSECPAIVSNATPLDFPPKLGAVTFSNLPRLNLACLSSAPALWLLTLTDCPALTFDSLCALAPVASLRTLWIEIHEYAEPQHRQRHPDLTLPDFLSASLQSELRARIPQLTSFNYKFHSIEPAGDSDSDRDSMASNEEADAENGE